MSIREFLARQSTRLKSTATMLKKIVGFWDLILLNFIAWVGLLSLMIYDLIGPNFYVYLLSFFTISAPSWSLPLLVGLLIFYLAVGFLWILVIYRIIDLLKGHHKEWISKPISMAGFIFICLLPCIILFFGLAYLIESWLSRLVGGEEGFGLRFVIFGIISVVGIGIATWRSLIAEKERGIAKGQHRTAEERRLDEQFTAALDGLSKELNPTNYPLHISSIMLLGSLAKRAPSLERCQRVIDTLCSFNEWMREYFLKKEFLIKLNEWDAYSLRQLSSDNAICSLGHKSITSEDLLREQRSQAAIREVEGIIRYLARDYLSILRGLDFSNKVLCGINLRGLYLPDINENIKLSLIGINLQGANLVGAKIQNTNLTEANLQRANMARLELHKVNLFRANLQGANLARANLQRANLWQAKMEFANLFNSNFVEANLSYANLQGAIMININLHEANIKQANLEGAILLNSDLGTVREIPQIPNILVSDVITEDISRFKDSAYCKIIDAFERASIFNIENGKIKDDNSLARLKESYKRTSKSVDYKMEKIPWLRYIEVMYPDLCNQLLQTSNELCPEQRYKAKTKDGK